MGYLHRGGQERDHTPELVHAEFRSECERGRGGGERQRKTGRGEKSERRGGGGKQEMKEEKEAREMENKKGQHKSVCSFLPHWAAAIITCSARPTVVIWVEHRR